MEKTIKVINEMEEKGLIRRYAIGGGIAALFYCEPFLTYDLDILFIPSTEKGNLIELSTIYDYLKKMGHRSDKEHIIIEGIPVQFIPVYNELVKEAVEKAITTRYKEIETKVISAEYIIAIMLQTFRPKDKERAIRLMEEADIDMRALRDILQRHRLKERFERFMRLYYEEEKD